MSKRTYPRYVGKAVGNPRWPATVTCEICPAPATCFAEVQWSWFRSDDELYKVCDEHLKLARTDLQKFVGEAEAARFSKRYALT
jgi:hypothetical protein